MRRLLAILILALLVNPGTAQAEGFKDGNFYLKACNHFLHLSSSTPADQLTPEYADWFAAGACAGYVRGAAEAYMLWAGYSDGPICNSHAPPSQLVRVFVKWLKEHPEVLHEPAYLLYFRAMGEAFICDSD